MNKLSLRKLIPVLGVSLLMPLASSQASAASFAVWLDGQLSDGGNAIPTRISSLGYSVTLVTTAQLETAGFLNAFDGIAVSRFGSNFGSSMSALAAANVSTYVGHGATQGGVAVFTNDMADNLFGSGSGDPFDANLDALFVNAVTYAAASHHGYIGEFNGAVMAMNSNSAGFSAIGLLQGNASSLQGFGPQFTYDVGPIGSGNPIDAGVTFPFTDSDNSTFLTHVTGADPANIVDIYSSGSISGEPAVLANAFVISGGNPNPGAVPEPSTYGLLGALALAGLVGYRRMKRAA